MKSFRKCDAQQYCVVSSETRAACSVCRFAHRSTKPPPPTRNKKKAAQQRRQCRQQTEGSIGAGRNLACIVAECVPEKLLVNPIFPARKFVQKTVCVRVCSLGGASFPRSCFWLFLLSHFSFCFVSTRNFIRLDSTRFNSIRLDSTRFDSIQFDSTRLDSIRLDSIRFCFLLCASRPCRRCRPVPIVPGGGILVEASASPPAATTTATATKTTPLPSCRRKGHPDHPPQTTRCRAGCRPPATRAQRPRPDPPTTRREGKTSG